MRLSREHTAVIWLACFGRANFTLPTPHTANDAAAMAELRGWLMPLEQVGLIKVKDKRSSQTSDSPWLAITVVATTDGIDRVADEKFALVDGLDGHRWAAELSADGGTITFYRGLRVEQTPNPGDVWPEAEKLGALLTFAEGQHL